MTVSYTIGDSPLGRILVASSEKGLCMVTIAKTDRELEERLHDHFPTATAKRDDRGLASLRRTVLRRMEGKDLDEPLKLDLQGTAFQVAVWKEMLRIPAGSTRSYADVARRIGKPNAFRAVANACGKNPIPVVVPCHRVVAANGLGGYTGGIDRKIFLLEKEGVVV
jgi:AraC family transcriptional regulator of adaptative response/methylated-DNA-[protein]-cysteine methyltransferase